MTNETKALISGSLKDLINKILDDKARLKNAINSIAEANDKYNINDKLINNLDNLEFEDNNMQNAIEYLILILSNIETQKTTANKEQRGELITMLDHILDNVKHMEAIINTVNEEAKESEDSDNEKDKEFFKDTLLPNLVPSGKVSNTIMWVIILVLILTTIHIVDNSALVATDNTIAHIDKVIPIVKKERE